MILCESNFRWVEHGVLIKQYRYQYHWNDMISVSVIRTIDVRQCCCCVLVVVLPCWGLQRQPGAVAVAAGGKLDAHARSYVASRDIGCCEQLHYCSEAKVQVRSGSYQLSSVLDLIVLIDFGFLCLFPLTLWRCLAVRYLRHHAIRERDVAKRTAGSGSYRKWLPSAMLRAALLGENSWAAFR